jgi:hypothetical protein
MSITPVYLLIKTLDFPCYAGLPIDNLPAHQIALIEPLIKAVGAKVLNFLPYSPNFNPIELWWS